MNAGIGDFTRRGQASSHLLNVETFLLSSDILLNKLGESLNPLKGSVK
jgi:hypothetical protein